MLKICITGGPGAGKSSIMSLLENILQDRGFHVCIVPETPTELILTGIKPGDCISMIDFQEFVLDKQLAKEKLYEKMADYCDPDKLVIFYDRGVLDCLAYVDRDIMEKMLQERNLTFSEVMDYYDAVFHLVTAADGAEEFYVWNDPSKEDVGNNAARSESPEEAIVKDKKTLEAWIGHSHLRVFDNSTDFSGKVDRVVEEVFNLLGEPLPKKIERKFLIEKPTQEDINNMGCSSASNIIQTYLVKKDENVERRVRQKGNKEEGFTFYYTEKRDVSNVERIEKEYKITPDEYVAYLSEADTSLHQISKVRYCFIYKNQYFELDAYSFSEEYALLEIKINDIDEEVELPPFIKLVKDVTGDKNYRNSSIAKNLSF